MRIEKVTKMQIQGRAENREVKTGFRDMMQALENIGSKEMPKRKDASQNRDVPKDKEVANDKADELKIEDEFQDPVEKENAVDSRNKEKSEQARGDFASKESVLGKEFPTIRKEGFIDNEEEQQSEWIKEGYFVSENIVAHVAKEIQPENVFGQREVNEEKTILKNPELQKQLDNAWMLKPEIKEMSKEAKTTLDLQKEIESATGKEVKISFEKELSRIEEKVNLEEIVPQSVQGSKTEEIEVIKIKVGEPEQIAPKVAKELEEKIQILQTGEKNYEIELDPQNLGKISVKIHFGEKATAVEMIFSNKKTMELMTKHMDQLTDGLQNAKGTTVNIQMSEQRQPDYLDQQERQQQQQQERQQKEEQRKSDEFINRLKQSLGEEIRQVM